MLIIDPPATAGGTDPVQERFLIFEAKPRCSNLGLKLANAFGVPAQKKPSQPKSVCCNVEP